MRRLARFRLPAWLRLWSRRLFGWQSLLRMFLLVLTVGISFTAWLVTTENGATLAIGWTSAITPNFRVRHESGPLIGPLQLRAIRIKGKSTTAIDHLRVDWAPSALLIGELHFLDVEIDTLHLQQPAPAPHKPGSPTAELPTLDLPLDLRVDRLHIARVEHQRGERHGVYQDIEFAGDWRDAQLNINHVQIAGARWQVNANGHLLTRDHWPASTDLRFTFPTADAPSFTVEGHVEGPLMDAMAVQLTSSGLLSSELQGRLHPLQPGMPFTAQLRAAQARIPPSAADDHAATLKQLTLQGGGEIAGNFSLGGSATLDTPWSEPVLAHLQAQGTWRGLETLQVNINDPRLHATLTTDYHWLDGQHFSGRVDMHHFDLALLNPALNSSLSGSLRVRGEIPPITEKQKTTRFDVTVDALNGDALGRQHVKIQGPLYWQDNLWHLNDFTLQQNNNVAVIRGTLGHQWQANATLTLPALDGILPGFRGHAAGSAHMSGAPADPQFALRLDLQQLSLPDIPLPTPLSRPAHLPSANWTMVANATLHDIDILDAHTVNEPFSVLSRGTVSWRHTLDWNQHLQYADLPLDSLVDGLFFPRGKNDGLISGTLSTQGQLGKSLESLTVDTQTHGQLSGENLNVSGRLHWLPARLAVEKLQVSHGKNQLQADGHLDEESINLTGSIQAPDLSKSLHDVSGKIQTTFFVNGPKKTPDARVTLTADALQYGDWLLDRIDGDLQLAKGGEENSRLELRANTIRLQKDNNAWPAIDGLQISANGTRDAHSLSFAGSSGPLAAAFTTAGAIDNTGWRGHLENGSVDIEDWHWESRGEPPLMLRFADMQVDIDPHCWTDGSARLCLTAPSSFGRSGYLAAEAFHLSLQKLLAISLPLDTRIDGTLGGLLTASWENGALKNLDGEIRNGYPLQIVQEDENNQAHDLAKIDSFLFDAKLANGHWQARAKADGSNTGTLAASIDMTPDEQLSGQLDIHALRPDFINAFIYQAHDVGGEIDAELTLGGTRRSPKLQGNIGLRDGHFAFSRIPLTVEQLQLAGKISGNQLQLDGSFLTPDSLTPATLDGHFQLTDGHWLGQAKLSGHKLQVGQQSAYRFSLSPELLLDLSRDELAITGNVQVPEGRVVMKKLPVQSVKVSSDVVDIHETKADEGRAFGIHQRVDLNVLLGDDIYFVALGAEGRLTGNLRLRSTPLLPMRLDGELYVKDGKYRAFGQDLIVRRGIVLFNGPTDRPLIEALAVREINDPSVREVGVQLSGSLLSPQTTLWSPTDLPPEETLAWLTTGQAPTTGSNKLSDEAAQAALSMGLAQGSALLSAVGQEIGLRDVQLSSTGAGTESEMQVGTHVSDRVFVGYSQRVFTGESSVLMRLQLSRRLMVEALSGIESAVDLFYIFEF